VSGTDETGRVLTADALMPIASITKLATALAILRLVDTGEVDLDAAIGRWIPDAVAGTRDLTARHCLTHIGGLPADVDGARAPYGPGLDWPMLAAACAATPPIQAAGVSVIYSNVGIGVLATIVERVHGTSFLAAARTLVFTPLGIGGTLGREPPQPPVRVAGVVPPLEPGEEPSPRESISYRFWRGVGFPWGGMVATAEDALRLVAAFAGRPSGFLSDRTRAEATRDQTLGLGGGMPVFQLTWPACAWGLGAELQGGKVPHWAPREAGPDSFGHVGATGTIAWHAPQFDTTWAMFAPRFFLPWITDIGPRVGAAVLRDAARG